MRLKNEIGEKRLQMKKKKVLFHQDNAPCQKSLATMAQLNELSFELLLHPPYLKGLAPSDYYLFAHLKKCSKERDSTPTRKSSPKRTLISRPKINHSTRKVLKCQRSAGLIVLLLKGTMLMNKVEFCQKNVFFLVSPGTY